MKIVNISVAVFLFPLIVLGWSTSTHQLLSQYACVNSRLVKDIFITKFNLDMGFVHPLTVSGETKTVAGWILDGEEKEDAGTPPLRDRSGRHFHNPLKVFGEAGLIRWVPLKQQLQSSILWAQDEAEQNKFTEGDMSWKRTRDLYYEALIWPEESMRHALFGLMFKGLGHQMHLVQDMSNPEHTRNDNHPWVTIESCQPKIEMSSFVQIRDVLYEQAKGMWESGKGEAFSKGCGSPAGASIIPSFPHPGRG